MAHLIIRRENGSLLVNKYGIIKVIQKAVNDKNLETFKGIRSLAESIANEIQEEIDTREKQIIHDESKYLRNLPLYEEEKK